MRRIILVCLILLVGGLAFSQRSARPHRDFKYEHNGYVDINYPCIFSDKSCVFAGWNFETAVGNYDDDYSGVPYTMTYNAGGGAATLVDDATYPHALGIGGTQGEAWRFDGVAYLDRADDGSFDMDLTNNPCSDPGCAGDFSVQCIVTPDSIDNTFDMIVSKYLAAGNQMSWALYRNQDDLYFWLSDDGTGGAGAASQLVPAAVFGARRDAFFTATYNYVTDGTSEMRVYFDNLATAGINNANGPVFDSTADFVIGAQDGGATPWEGLIHDCRIYKGIVITEDQHDEQFAVWQGRKSQAGPNVYTSVASASPPAVIRAPAASGTEPFIIDNPANSFYIGAPVAGDGGLYGAGDLTSKWWRGSCETCAAGDCTGWTISENQGGGAGTLTADCDTTTSAHGSTSILFTSDGGGAPKAAYADGACQVNWIGQDVSLIVYGVTATGAASCSVQLLEYDTAVCGTLLATNTVWGAGDPGATWAELSGTVAAAAWNGATSSWLPRIRCDDTGAAYTVNFDAAMALQSAATYDTDAGCYTDAAADAVCNLVQPSIRTPISPADWTIEATVRSPIDWAVAAPTRRVFEVPGTAGNNNRMYAYYQLDVLSFWVHDSAGVARSSTVACAKNADQDVELRFTHTAAGEIIACCDGVCDATPGTAAIMDGINATMYVGMDVGGAGTRGESWIRGLRFYRRVKR